MKFQLLYYYYYPFHNNFNVNISDSNSELLLKSSLQKSRIERQLEEHGQLEEQCDFVRWVKNSSLKIDGEKRPELTKLSNIWDRDTAVQVYNFVAIKWPDKWQESCESRLIEKQEGVPRKEAGWLYGGSLSAPLVPRLNLVLLLTVLNGVGLSSAFLPRLIKFSIFAKFRRNRLESTIFTTPPIASRFRSRSWFLYSLGI